MGMGKRERGEREEERRMARWREGDDMIFPVGLDVPSWTLNSHHSSPVFQVFLIALTCLQALGKLGR